MNELINLPTLMSPNHIVIGADSIKIISNKGIKLKYQYTDILNDFHLSLISNITKGNNEELTSFDYQSGIIFTKSDFSNEKIIRELKLNSTKSLFILRTKLGLNFGYAKSKDLIKNFNLSGTQNLQRLKFGVNLRSNFKYLELVTEYLHTSHNVKTNVLKYNFRNNQISNSIKLKNKIWVAEINTIIRETKFEENRNLFSYVSGNLSILKVLGKDNIGLNFNIYNLLNSKNVKSLTNTNASSIATIIPTSERIFMIRFIYN